MEGVCPLWGEPLGSKQAAFHTVCCVQTDKAYLNFRTNSFCETMQKIVLMCSQVLPTISTKHNLPSRINQELLHLAKDLPCGSVSCCHCDG